MRVRIGIVVVAACAVAASVGAQENVAGAKAALERNQVVSTLRAPFEKIVKGAPYSADTVVQSTQTLGDGTHINRKTTGRIYRDTEGRTRREEDGSAAAGPVSVRTAGGNTVNLRSEGRSNISIVDPVAGFSYSLDSENKIAWRTPIAAADAVLGKVAADEKMVVEAKLREAMAARGGGAGGFGGGETKVARGYVEATDSPLEHSTIDGLAVEGHRRTSTLPAGTVGNDQPITISSEEWTSPDLKVLVMTRHSDPRSGEQTYKLTNVVRAEPDASLFVVPPDYTVKDTGIRKLEASRK